MHARLHRALVDHSDIFPGTADHQLIEDLGVPVGVCHNWIRSLSASRSKLRRFLGTCAVNSNSSSVVRGCEIIVAIRTELISVSTVVKTILSVLWFSILRNKYFSTK